MWLLVGAVAGRHLRLALLGYRLWRGWGSHRPRPERIAPPRSTLEVAADGAVQCSEHRVGDASLHLCFALLKWFLHVARSLLSHERPHVESLGHLCCH